MAAIFTIALNPSLDFSTEAPAVTPGPKLRCTAPQIDPGGGGVNVSRAISKLEGQSTAFIAVGGPTGARIETLLSAEGIAHVAFATSGETRQNIAITDQRTGEQYRFVLPGPEWSPAQCDAAARVLSEAVPPGAFTVLSGSQPPGMPADFPSVLVKLMKVRGARVIVDTSGPPMQALTQGTGNPPFALRLDDVEAQALMGSAIETIADLADFAQMLVDRGVADNVLLSMGGEGSVLAGAGLNTRYRCTPPPTVVMSAVGAGDSFLGGFTLALSRGVRRHEALCHGTAAACAAVMTPATHLCSRADFDRILPQCTLSEI